MTMHPSRPNVATVGYCYDSDDDRETHVATYAQDMGHVPFAVRACDACNDAGERAHELAASVAAASQTAQPIIADASKDALAQTERAGVAASDAVAAALITSVDASLRRKLCDSAIKGGDRVLAAALPAADKIEAALAPCIQAIGKLLLSVDQDICREDTKDSVLRPHVMLALSSMERVGLALVSASALVEGRMLHVSAALDHRLGKLASWGDTQLGISMHRGSRPRRFV